MTTVLVVDDEPDVRLLVRLAFERAGYEVIEAAGGEAALESLEASTPDCMLLDLRMPGLDGWAVLQRLQANGLIDQIPIVVQSAHARGFTEAEVLAAGARAFLAKPFSVASLLATVERALRTA
jgi:CheY-like chemotaxis protein